MLFARNIIALSAILLPGTSFATQGGEQLVTPTAEDLDLVAECARWSAAAYDGQSAFDRNQGQYYRESNGNLDSGGVIVQSDRCIIVIQGTDFGNRRDAVQNLDLRDIDVHVKEDPTQFCSVMNGMNSAYHGAADLGMEDIIDEQCVGKELVFTGHSQGGGACQVGAIRYFGRNVRIITFGTAPLVYGECNYLPGIDKFWNFVQTEPESVVGSAISLATGIGQTDSLQFDPVPFIEGIIDTLLQLGAIAIKSILAATVVGAVAERIGDVVVEFANRVPEFIRAWVRGTIESHVNLQGATGLLGVLNVRDLILSWLPAYRGAFYVLPPHEDVDTTEIIGAPSKSAFTGVSVDIFDAFEAIETGSIMGGLVTAHMSDNYLRKVEKLRNLVRDGSPLTLDGFAPFTWCGEDWQCQGTCTGTNLCTGGNAGEPCGWGTDCDSGRCDFTWGGRPRCFNVVPYGGPCNEDGDCGEGNRCVGEGTFSIGGQCRDGRNGDPCQFNDHCQSERCDTTWLGARRCMPKVEIGEPCNENTDCISNNCPTFRLLRRCAAPRAAVEG